MPEKGTAAARKTAISANHETPQLRPAAPSPTGR